MTGKEKALQLKEQMQANLTESILPFWSECLVDEKNGGFWGRVDSNCQADEEYPKAIVLNTRLLWTFTRAYSVFGDEKYARLAKRAYEYIVDKFWDPEFGGVFWMLTAKGVPLEVEKRTYGQAFLIYSMAEYYRVFREQGALEKALEVFEKLNSAARYESGGYADSLSRDWKKDMWLNRWFMNGNGAPLLLNSHLHLFEATIALFSVTHSRQAGQVLYDFLEFLMEQCVDERIWHLKAGMTVTAARIDTEISFGHDSECCYLMTGAARLLQDRDLIQKADVTALKIMDNVLREGLDPVNGGLYNERCAEKGYLNKVKIWWVQAEGITSFYNCYQLTGEEKYLDVAVNIWEYVKSHLVDPVYGDWYCIGQGDIMDVQTKAQILERKVRLPEDKANKSKCPYHNSRTCFEIMERVDSIT